MESKELFQKQVLEDIKAIAKDLSMVHSFSGLLAHQQKIQNLYEKYIFLKQLHTSRYEHFMEGTVLPEMEKNNVKEAIAVDKRDFQEMQPVEEVSKITEASAEKIIAGAELKVLEDEKPAEVNEAKPAKESLKPLGIQIAEVKPVEKDRKLNPVKLDFNDSIAFISQLFGGNKSYMDAEFVLLNETRSMVEAKKWMEEMFHKYNWRDKEEYVERLSALIVHRFES
ncbi:hypothetical protein [Apibacter sp. HY039]|uniref:hypothetical protein n=1 Tax=Apibacter sp. HY039 TaxID=2501476 RepID=UPI000FEBA13E|nr:hypothetical protein [Apibacter sp. HY039]